MFLHPSRIICESIMKYILPVNQSSNYVEKYYKN